MGRVTTLLIDHVSGEGKETKNRSRRIYGSVFKENWARNCWELRKDQRPGESMMQLALYHTKVNRGKLHEPISFTLDFTEDGIVQFRSANVSDSQELSAPLTGPDQVIALLKANEPMMVKELVLELTNTFRKSVSEGTVRTWLGRLAERGFAVKRGDGRWEPALPKPSTDQEEIPF